MQVYFQSVMSFPTKEQRAVCWSARDKLWECLDKHEDPLNRSKLPKECAELRKLYEQGCPAQWVKHFDRKREYLQFKERIEKQGYEPLNNEKS